MRDQGQFIIQSSVIRDSSGFGLNLDAAPQAQPGASGFTGPRPYPGAPRNMVTLNTTGAAPGIVVMNNLLARNGSGGINISGDISTANGLPPSSFARIVNNTLIGTVGGAAGVGINISERSSPTLLNNIVANFQTGINNVGNTAIPEIGGTIYKGNTTNIAPAGLAQSFQINLTGADPLFINEALGRFFPAPLSQAIDSSIASLENRSSIETVKDSIGFSTSSIVAPTLDINGLVRSDDPNVNTPAGQGQNVFIDRGAYDRVDFTGPIAVILVPQDNDASGVDSDVGATYLHISQAIKL